MIVSWLWSMGRTVSFAIILLLAGGLFSAAHAQGGPLLTATPDFLQFVHAPGSPAPLPKTFQVTSSVTAVSITATAMPFDPPPAPIWFTVTPGSGTTPVTFTVTIDPTGLGPGFYGGSILISDASVPPNTATVYINLEVLPVTFTPSSLAFTYAIGGSTPAAQDVAVTASQTTDFGIDGVSTVSGGNWLLAGSSGTTTPATLTASLDPTVLAGLPPGTYQGTITLNILGGEVPVQFPIPVTLSVVAALLPSPGSLPFSYAIGGALPASRSVSITASGGVAVTFDVSTTGGSWLSVTPARATTPASLSVTANPAGLGPGTYNGSVVVTLAADPSVSVTIAVTLTITAPLSVAPPTLSFDSSVGAGPPPSQPALVTSVGGPMPFAAASSASWLVFTQSGSVTPSTLTVSVNPAGLAPGTYNGTLTVTSPFASNGAQILAVTLKVAAPLSVAPSALTFNYSVGASLPASQPASVTSTGGPLPFAATSSAGWLVFTQSGSVTPSTLTVSVNPAGLAPGTYSGTLTVTSPFASNGAQTVAVTLNVTAPLAVAPSTLTFTYSAAAGLPASQPALVTSAGGPMPFVATSGASWLVFTQSGSVTAATLTVSVNPAGMAPGIYNGTITVTSPLASNGAQVVSVTLNVAPLLSVSPPSLTFSLQQGGTAPIAQPVAVTSGSLPVAFSVTSSAGWLSASPAGGSTPATLLISVAAGALEPGTYVGTIRVAAVGFPGMERTVAVTLKVTQALQVETRSIVFRYEAGGSLPPPLRVDVTASSGPVDFSASATTASGVNWLSVSQGAGSVSVSANPAGLAEGSYSGSVQINSDVGSAMIDVTLYVTAPLSVDPGSLAFTALLGGESPPSQSFSVTSGGSPNNYLVTVSTNAGVEWLSANPKSGVTAGSVSVSVNPAGLPAGTYQGTITLRPLSGRNPKTVGVTLAVVAPGDLILSPPSLSFAGDPAGTGTTRQVVSVTSASPVPVPFSVTAEVTNSPSGADFAKAITVTPSSGSTPALVTVSVDPRALQAGKHGARLRFNAVSKAYAVNTTLEVAPGIPVLSASPPLLQFRVAAGSVAPSEKPLIVENVGGGPPQPLSVTVSRAPWLSAVAASDVLAPGQRVPVQVTVDASQLRPGPYLGVIRIRMGDQVREVPVILLALTSEPYIGLEFNGVQFRARAGEGFALARELGVFNLGGGALNWKASLLDSPAWLALDQSKPGKLILSTRSEGLAVGTYYALVEIADPNAVNSPQLLTAVMQVLPASTIPVPTPSPEGLLFVARPGAAAPPPQAVRIHTSSAAPVSFQSSAHTSDGTAWLAVSPSKSQASTGSPATLTVSVNPASLRPGVYHGGVSSSVSPGVVRTVNVVLIVQPATAGSAAKPGSARLANGCTPSRLVPIYTGLVNSFATPAGWPVPVTVRVVDDCAAAVPEASVVLKISKGEPRFLALARIDQVTATFSGTWTPASSGSEVSVEAQAAAGLLSGTADVVGAVADNTPPVLPQNAMLNNFNPEAGGPLAPGGVFRIVGNNLALSAANADVLPLPTEIGGTRVLIQGRAAPLYSVSEGQITAQVPLELEPRLGYPVLVSVNGALTVPDAINVIPARPGLASSPSGQVVAQHADGSLVTPDSPAAPGETIITYLVGMGRTATPVVTGAPAPADPLARVIIEPAVTLDGRPVEVSFAGLTPGSVGLYQINFVVPGDAGSGDLALVVSQEEQQSNSTKLPVRAPQSGLATRDPGGH